MVVPIPKGYVYVAMAFSLSVELLNSRSRDKKALQLEHSSHPLI